MKKFEDADLFSHYAVRSTDIDLGHHMNNVAYVRLLLDCFFGKRSSRAVIFNRSSYTTQRRASGEH